MSIAEELEALNANLAAAKAAVAAAGGTVGDTGLAGLAAEIATIPTGGGGGEIVPPADTGTYGTILVSQKSHYVFEKSSMGMSPLPEGFSIEITDPAKFDTWVSSWVQSSELEDAKVTASGAWLSKFNYTNPGWEFSDNQGGETVLSGDPTTEGQGFIITHDFQTATEIYDIVLGSRYYDHAWHQLATVEDMNLIIDSTSGSPSWALNRGTTLSDGTEIYSRNIRAFYFGSYNLTAIPQSAFGSIVGLERIGPLPSTVRTIGSTAFSALDNLEGPFTIPASVTSISSDFLTDCKKFVGPLIVETTVLPDNYDAESNGPLVCRLGWSLEEAEQYPAYNGVLLQGSGAQNWKASIPDKTSDYSQYRKLLIEV